MADALATVCNILVLQPKRQKDSDKSCNETSIEKSEKNILLDNSFEHLCFKGVQDSQSRKPSASSNLGNAPYDFSESTPAIGSNMFWRRANLDEFKPFYERVFAREYKFAVQPPLCEDCKTVNESAKKRTSNNSSNLMQRLLKKESTRLREKASAEVQEKWCIFYGKCLHLSQYRRFEDASRLHGILTASDSNFRPEKIWRQLSRAILNGELSNTNACYKISEGLNHIFYFEDAEDTINEWLQSTFSGGVRLQKFE